MLETVDWGLQKLPFGVEMLSSTWAFWVSEAGLTDNAVWSWVLAGMTPTPLFVCDTPCNNKTPFNVSVYNNIEVDSMVLLYSLFSIYIIDVKKSLVVKWCHEANIVSI